MDRLKNVASWVFCIFVFLGLLAGLIWMNLPDPNQAKMPIEFIEARLRDVETETVWADKGLLSVDEKHNIWLFPNNSVASERDEQHCLMVYKNPKTGRHIVLLPESDYQENPDSFRWKPTHVAATRYGYWKVERFEVVEGW